MRTEPDPLDTAAPGPSLARPTVLLAMDEATCKRVLVRAVRDRLDVAADILPLRADETFLDKPALRTALAGTDVLLTGWGCPQITPEVLAAAPRLRAIVHAAGSVKHFVDPGAFDRGIQVSSAVVANAVPVAEFTVATIVLSGKRAFRLGAQYKVSRRMPDPRQIPGNYGTTVGLLGASRIGRLVAERLRAFDLEVLISDPYLSAADAATLGAELVDLDSLFRRSDVLSVHAPLLPETVGLVDARLLALLRDGSVLINTARGRIVDAGALENECVAGRIDAVLDVTDPEPLPPDSKLLDLPNVFLTPHLAGAVGNEVARLGELAVGEIERLAAGLPLQHAISPAELGRIA
ncbi:D-isomer specific 2-hydroxyacid dehydrogenase NAD-binding protein [Kribbella flavida DSM 17836]|uniref:D-isomer specific 2-hydroxyacid dehydrogenase NAD-binding protein n=1 Tax=Kribbella flavida (strain DSM 17836 / JCM 10339 / NBRC 14399) TaxID=479435 RepID=D2PKY2_KRIFD|nr:hydroxyacid dehydrogenase [Kribbella flavida]ADB32449.1 D-isomer specific 2-hydroxyacid dehydrogenase NAD-binding protein [Kribbella flavida DSM 17836]